MKNPSKLGIIFKPLNKHIHFYIYIYVHLHLFTSNKVMKFWSIRGDDSLSHHKHTHTDRKLVKKNKIKTTLKKKRAHYIQICISVQKLEILEQPMVRICAGVKCFPLTLTDLSCESCDGAGVPMSNEEFKSGSEQIIHEIRRRYGRGRSLMLLNTLIWSVNATILKFKAEYFQPTPKHSTLAVALSVALYDNAFLICSDNHRPTGQVLELQQSNNPGWCYITAYCFIAKPLSSQWWLTDRHLGSMLHFRASPRELHYFPGSKVV